MIVQNIIFMSSNNSFFKDLKPNKADFSAGLVVFLVAIPLCLGIALASDAPLMSGIIAGLVGGIVVGLFGGSALGVSGPAAGLVSIMLMAKTDLGSFEVILLAVLIAGIFQLILGIAKAGVIAYYIPSSVIKGMLAAIGIIIILKQIPHAVGWDLDFEGDMSFQQQDGHNTLTELQFMFDQFQWGALIICAVGLGLLILWQRPFMKKIPLFQILSGPMMAVISGIVLQLVFLNFIPDLAVVSLPDHSAMVNLPAGESPLTWLTFPDFSAIINPDVWVYAAIIAGVASVESLLCAEATDKMDPQKRITPMNKELRGQGIANIISGLIGGLPITQVIVRSSANVQSGGKTRVSAISHGLLILLAVLILPGVLNLIPLASLAAILLVVGAKLTRPSLFVAIFKKGWSQFIPFIVTIVAILLTDLLTGIGIGLSVGAFFVLYNNFQHPYELEVEENGDNPRIRIRLSEIVSFLNKGNILSTFRSIPDGAHVILDESKTYRIDPDVQEVIDEFREGAVTRGITVEEVKNPVLQEGKGPKRAPLHKILGSEPVASK